MSVTRLNKNNKPIFIFHPMVVDTLTKNLVDQINTSWEAFAQLETSKHMMLDLKQHFSELNHIIININTANSKDQCAKSLQDLYDKVKSMVYLRQFIVKEELDFLTRTGAKSVITNLVINLFESIIELQKKLKNQEPSIMAQKEEKTKTPESKRISQLAPEMTSHILSKEKEEKGQDLDEDEILAPIDVLNTILEYDDFNKIKGHGEAPFVPTLFNSIKIKIENNLRTLMEAAVSGKPDEAKAILEEDPSLLLRKLEEKDFVIAPSGHKFNLKPYQAAMAVGDYQMAKLLEPFFVDKEEMKRQFEEQCPKGWEAKEEEKWQPIYKQRDTLTLAILDSNWAHITLDGNSLYYELSLKKESPVEQELHKFWRLLDAKLDEVITTGKRPFNLNLILTTLKSDRSHEYNDPRALLFVHGVLGYDGLQRFLSINDVQAIQAGLDASTLCLKNNIPQGRSTRFRVFHNPFNNELYWPRNFYPIQKRGSKGFNFAIWCNQRADAAWRNDFYLAAGQQLALYINSKKQAYAALCGIEKTPNQSRRP